MANPLIVGADLSSKYLALVAKHPVTPTAAVVKYPLGRRATDRYTPANSAEAMDCMLDYLDQIGPMAVPGAPRMAYIEAPLVGRGGAKTTVVQSYVNGVVQACFVKAGFTVELVYAQIWKKVICGNGGASKSDVGRRVRSRWPSVSRACNGDQDLTDAAAICLYGSIKHAADLRP